MNCENSKKGICPFSFGVAVGIVCGLFMMSFAWMAAFWGVGALMIEQYANFYYGYAPTFLGGLAGGLWGLIDGFIFGFLVAYFYNCCTRCCKKSGKGCGYCSDKEEPK